MIGLFNASLIFEDFCRCAAFVLGEHLLGWVNGNPHPVIETIRNSKYYIRVLLYAYYTTITGWGGPPKGWESGQVSLAFGLVMGGRGKTFDQLKLV